MPTIDPDPARLGGLLQQVPSDKPVTMLNLLRFRDVANYRDGESQVTGQAAYSTYSELVMPFLSSVGGRVVWSGTAHAGLIAPEDEHWDYMLLVRYPSIDRFMEMVTNPDYQAITHHRTAALADARLVATVANEDQQG